MTKLYQDFPYQGVLRKLKLLFVFCLFLFGTNNLRAKDTSFDVSYENQSIESVLKDLRKLTKFNFLYMEGILPTDTKVTVIMKDASISEILERFLPENGLSYRIEENNIIINKLKTSKEMLQVINTAGGRVVVSGNVVDEFNNPVVGVTVRQKGTSNYTATDTKGFFTMTVNMKSTNPETFTFSFIGMKEKEVALIGENNIIALQEDAMQLEAAQVIHVGYQTTTRRDLVGAVQQIKAEDVMMQGVKSIDEMLQGQVAGMIVETGSFRAGSSPTIQIRGQNTLLGNRSPIWVVDGIIQPEIPDFNGSSGLLSGKDAFTGEEQGTSDYMRNFLGSQISWLNPNDIATITILKDASATAIYGSKAANGVVVVTTKMGTADKISVNFSTNFSITPRPVYSDYRLMNSQERIEFSKEAFESGVYYSRYPRLKDDSSYESLMRSYELGEIDQEEFSESYRILETANTNWLKLLTRNSVTQSHNLSISGGTRKSTYAFSLSYYNQEGLEIGNDTKRYTAKLRSTFQLLDALKLNVSLGGTLAETNMFTNGVAPLNYALKTSRALPAYRSNGDLWFYKTGDGYRYNSINTVDGFKFNIFNEIDNTRANVTSPQLDASINLIWTLSKLFTFEVVGGVTNTNRRVEAYAGEATQYIAQKYRGWDIEDRVDIDLQSKEYKAALLPNGGEFSTENIQTLSYNIQGLLRFNKTLNQLHRFNALAAWEVRSSHTNSGFNTVWGYSEEKGRVVSQPTSFDSFKPITPGTNQPLGIFEGMYNGGWRSVDRKDNYLSLFGTASYVFNNKYILNANIRNDASNKFGNSVKTHFDPTYSFGLGWTVSDEPFMEVLNSFVSYLKLSATYGIQGNVLNTVSPELLLNGKYAIDTEYYGRPYTTISQLPNNYLAWERSKSWDFGVDISLFKSFMTATFNYYKSRSNAINNSFVSAVHGMYKAPQNGNLIDNNGVELVLNFNPINKNDLKLNLSVNWSKNWNTLHQTNLFTNNSSLLDVYLNGQDGSRGLVEPNYAVGAFWAYSFQGLDPKTGAPLIQHINTNESTALNSYTDLLVYAGKTTPDITAGLNLNLRYKSFGISTMFSALIGKTTRLANPYSSFDIGKTTSPKYTMPDPLSNVDSKLNNRWKNPGDERVTNIPALYTGRTPITYDLPRIGDITLQGYNLYEMWNNSDALLVDASFLRCKQVSFSWYITNNLTRSLKLSNLNLSATITNIFVLADSKWEGMDPEMKTSRAPRIFSLGLSIGF